MTRLVALSLALIFGVCPGIAQGQQVLYGITRNNELLKINIATGAGTLVGLLSTNMNPPGLSFRASKLYTYDAVMDRAREIDPANAATLATIDIGVMIMGGGDIAFRSDGIGFLTAAGGSPERLITFDITVPNNALITASLNPSMFGLAFNAMDVLHGLAGGGGGLYTIDQTTGAVTLVGPTGLSGFPRGALAIDAAGKTYAALGPLVGTSSLYQINPTTGAATLIGDIGFDAVSGLSFARPPPPPPPPPPPSPPAPPAPGPGNEGSYPGSNGPGGSEGAFGQGGRSASAGIAQNFPGTAPVLLGPFRHVAGLTVFNVSHRTKMPGYSTIKGQDPTGWTMVAATLMALTVLLMRRA